MEGSGVQVFTLRMPAQLKEWVAKRAARNHRSTNGELLALIERERIAEMENAQPAATGQALVTQ
ncbi:Arc family DNA-binding protein [Paraburkholderia bannensis]|uniref:Arc family DNA-binding protein n=1 Tax=Paraburkholderia bannensis TaxID=765414 RepID=UPI002ABDAE99|nr:Arc family DNA-binding protein [Paraburkholderia bannensis]